MSGKSIIGVDARPLCHPGTGLYRYTLELLKRMTSMGGQWHLYSPATYDDTILTGPDIHHRSAPAARLFGGSQSSQFLFPRWLRQDGVQVYWGTRHDLPLAMPADVRAVLTVHDLTWMTHGDTMPMARRLAQRLLMPRSLQRAQKVICDTQHVARELEEHFPGSRDKLQVIPLASSLPCATGAAIEPPGESDYFLFVGTMEPRKNLPRLLQAYKRYLAQCDSPKKMKLAGGEGWGGVDPRQLVAENGLERHVEVLGHVSDNELAQLYAGAYAVLMPSLYEGFGLPVVEAMSFGVPSLVSENSAMSEVAAGAGLAVNPLSIDSLAAALTEITDTASLHDELSRAAVSRARDFNWDEAAKQMYEALQQ